LNSFLYKFWQKEVHGAPKKSTAQTNI